VRAVVGAARGEHRAIERLDLALEVSVLAGRGGLEHVHERVGRIEHADALDPLARELWLRCSEELPNTSGLGLEPLSVSIGLESGMALVGSFGAASRRVHTVLGQTVTIALRLQGLTADLAYPVLVGPAAAHRIGLPFEQASLALKPLGSFLLPGLQHSCKVFTLRTLLQPGSLAEQSTLHYLHQHKNNVA
jgi:adenylate cyclase